MNFTIIALSGLLVASQPITPQQIDEFTQCIPSETTVSEWMVKYNIKNTPEKLQRMRWGAIKECFRYYITEAQYGGRYKKYN
jgi:hypothetical protein